MKNSILSVLVIFIAVTADAQKIRFTDKTNVWKTTGNAGECGFDRNFFYDVNDTFFDGTEYQVLIGTTVGYSASGGGTCLNYQNSVYIREDTATKRVYIRGNYFSPDTVEYLLYDFNLSVGDTIAYPGISVTGGTYAVDSVIVVDSILIYGRYHRAITLQSKYGHGGRKYTAVEGVGSTAGPLFPDFFVDCFEYYESLACFGQDTVNPVFTAPFFECADWATSADSFRNGMHCSTLAIGKVNLASDVTIFPNPATDQINITLNIPAQNNASVSIYDVTGACVMKTTTEQKNELTINIANRNSGLYMVIVQDNTGIIKKEKIVVQH